MSKITLETYLYSYTRSDGVIWWTEACIYQEKDVNFGKL